MRAFIAIEVPETVKEGAAAAQGRLKGAGVLAGWTRPEGLHLTLKFLGETVEERVPEIMQALARALCDTPRFRLCIEGGGTFPNPASPRVVWLGVTGEVARLVALQAAVEDAMAGLGVGRDERPYTPHLTLGRVKRIGKRAAWLKELDGLNNFVLPGFDVDSVALIRSELKPQGAVYHELGRVALK